jgi:hypothetical protein
LNPVKLLESTQPQYVKKSILSPEITCQLSDLGLELETVKKHSNYIKQFANSSDNQYFKIFDTCRLDNGGIIPFSLAQNFLDRKISIAKKNYIGFVPAAGAASRYIQPFESLAQLIDERSKREFTTADISIIIEQLQNLKDLGAHNWPLPDSLSRLLEAPVLDFDYLSPDRCKQIVTELFLPKALYPCVKEKLTFLQIKDLEHRLLPQIKAQVFITPPSMARVFEMHLHRPPPSSAKNITTNQIDSIFIEQGASLSTIRFNLDGTPYRDVNDRISIVPAGHGALAELFSDLKKDFNDCHSLFIRNIDNISGFSPEKVSITSSFLSIHNAILDILNGIRTCLSKKDVSQASLCANHLTHLISKNPPDFLLRELSAIENNVTSEEFLLWSVLAKVFHTPVPSDPSIEKLYQCYARPFNLLGQVPNTQNDIGGTPCFIHTSHKIEKICLEVPHISDNDRNRVLMDANKATHFNPVFAAAEIPNESNYYSKRNQEFWLIAKKTFRGNKVAYVETVLYELLGNSRMSNCIFIEIPRYLFNPHKAPSDATNRTLENWRI